MDTLQEALDTFAAGPNGAPLERPDATHALAEIGLHCAIRTAQSDVLSSTDPVTVIVKVPTEQWVEPIRWVIDNLVKTKLAFATAAKKKGTAGSTDVNVSMHISSGASVFGIATDPQALPQTLILAATHELEVPPLTVEMIEAAMDRCLADPAPSSKFTNLDVAALDFDTICACLPKGVTKATAFLRITRAVERRLSTVQTPRMALPGLEEAIEYGSARAWGLELQRDINDVRAGRLAWDAVDRGIVLYGEPGTGKTTFAKILGEACGLNTLFKSAGDLFATSAGDLGAVIKAQRLMFEEAVASAPSLLCIDELDAYPNPYTVSDHNKDWWMPVIMDFQLLLDSAVSRRDGVIVCGTTNRLQDISPALLRKGRFERAMHIGRPDVNGLVRLMKTQLSGDLPDDLLMPLARAAEGSTAADVMDWVRAARRTSRRERRSMTSQDMMEQICPPDVRSGEELERVAIHEAGHAIAGIMLGFELGTVTIRSSSGSGGRVSFAGRHQNLLTRADLEDQVICRLAGRAAEIVMLGTPSSGSGGHPSSDLAIATRTLIAMQTSLGLGDQLSWQGPDHDASLLAEYSPSVRNAVEADLQALQQKAVAVIKTHIHLVKALSVALLDRRSLTGVEVAQLLLTN